MNRPPAEITDPVVESIRAEYRRYKARAEAAIAQLAEEDLGRAPDGNASSVATIVWHVSGNLTSRFTDFLTSDGEKPWRNRESEFEPRDPGRRALLAKWEEGWSTLFEALEGLRDEDLDRVVTIRGVELSVLEALQRSLTHATYHVGQIVQLGRLFLGDDWEWLTIPPGGSEAYARAPTMERASDEADRT